MSKVLKLYLTIDISEIASDSAIYEEIRVASSKAVRDTGGYVSGIIPHTKDGLNPFKENEMDGIMNESIEQDKINQ